MFTSLRSHSDWALLFLRIVVGAIFIYHGYQKWAMTDPTTTVLVLKFLEPIAGVAILIGVVTEIAVLLLGIVMVGAIYMKMTGFGQAPLDFFGTFGGGGKWEFDLMILAGCIVLLFLGAGRYSVDFKIKK